MRTKRCTPEILGGRLAKAEQFWEVADMVRGLVDEQDPSEIGDAYVTLCVHAGIAAADALCCAGLGEHAQGENHNDAVELLARVDKDAGRALRALLALKTKAGYSHTSATAEEFKRAGRNAEALVLRARERG
ncbi:hypothetical protein [Amycolatopsis sp. NBC_01286]|uniref:hypothetical protein n=1 Tax=Amycolatopsis sp. NBC_01286 TaxID=2903560 RepID=UPI002E1361FC|nr:hypothetical protein OG570_06360 [Amycolatopsis sp. NBC_01286]